MIGSNIYTLVILYQFTSLFNKFVLHERKITILQACNRQECDSTNIHQKLNSYIKTVLWNDEILSGRFEHHRPQ